MEIQAQDLRIGNIIRCKDNDKIVPAFRGKIVPVDITILRLICECKPDYYEPIPLTEEILLKCGFEKRGFLIMCDDRYDRYCNGHLYLCTINGKKWIVSKGSDICEVEYLHQLQNLYFALTGEELEVSL